MIMKAGKSLNAWLMSQHAQAEAASGMEDFAREFRQLPALVALGREVDTGEAAGVEAILAAARRFLQRDQDIESCVEMMIAAAAGDSFFRPTLRLATSEVHSGLLVFDRPCLSIQVAIMPVDALAAKRTYRTGRASIAFTGQWMIYRFLRAQADPGQRDDRDRWQQVQLPRRSCLYGSRLRPGGDAARRGAVDGGI